MDNTAVKEILEVCKRLDEKCLVNAYEGNVSIRRDGFIYITPAGKNKAFLTEEMISVFDENTKKQVGGTNSASSEMLLHVNSYKIRPDVFGAIHCHPTMLTAYSLCNKPIETKAYPEMIGNFKRIECAPYGRPGTDEIFNVAKEYILRNDVVLLGNHGVIALGKDVFDAMNKVEAAEAIAKVLYYAERVGKVVDLPDPEVEMFLKK